ncbi:MAG: hypothetical protein JNK46_04230 [Methylobacteriaceae bacterium]|nr:hypothetical protein [Methylobacteriaceae bacterium]
MTTRTMTESAATPAPDARLSLTTLGAFDLVFAGRKVPLAARKSRAVLGYLAIADGRRETRERLVGLLWSEVDEARARASLRQSVYEIREALDAVGCPGFAADKTQLSLAAAPLAVDLLAVLDEAQQGRAHPLLLEQERLLDQLFRDFESADVAFHGWLLAKRQSYEERLAARLEAALQKGGAESERIARALLRLDPTHEVAARHLIRARADSGDVSAALGVYKALWDVLDREYDVEPSRETQMLVAAIRMAQPDDPQPAPAAPAAVGFAAPAAAVTTPVGARLLVSIGGFETTGVREELRYLVHGFRRELIASLVRFREWVIRDNESAPAGRNIADAGLGEYIVDATAFESAEGVRLLVMLRNARTNDYLWSERFQLTLGAWFDAQQAVVRRLAAAMNVFISIGRAETAVGAPQGDLIAYDLWLRGQSMIARFNFDDVGQSTRLMEEIIARAPHFAPAYSTLAQIKNSAHMGIPGLYRDAETARSAIALGREAARLDPVDSRSQLCLGWALIMAGQFGQGAIHHEAALDLNENDSWTATSTALAAAFAGAHDIAERRVARALELAVQPTPLHYGYFSQVAFMRGDYARASEEGLRAAPTIHFRCWTAAAHGASGDLARAREAAEQFLEQTRAAWRGATAFTPAAAVDWFLHCFPIQHEADWARVADGLARAGLRGQNAGFARVVSAAR